MFELREGLIYHEATGVLGEIESIDFKTETITVINDEEKSQKFKIDETKFLGKLGTLHKNVVYDHDVLEADDGRLFLLVLNQETGNLRIDLLDDRLNIVEEGKSEFSKKELHSLEKFLQVSENYYVLISLVETVDFNIKVVKSGAGDYYYACNDKDNEVVDLITVVFIGTHLVKEEDYERESLAYDEYLGFIDNETLYEVSEQEFERYARGVMFGSGGGSGDEYIDTTDDYEDEDEDEDNYEDETSVNDAIAQHWENVSKAKDNDLSNDKDFDDEDEDEEEDEDFEDEDEDDDSW